MPYTVAIGRRRQTGAGTQASTRLKYDGMYDVYDPSQPVDDRRGAHRFVSSVFLFVSL